MADKNRAPQNDLSIDVILAEAQTLKDKDQPEPLSPRDSGEPGGSSGPREAPPSFSSPEAIAEEARRALGTEASELPGPPPAPQKEKKRRSLFGRRKRDIPELGEEDDIYYGLRLKSLQEYSEDYEKAIRVDSKKMKDAQSDSAFSYLFEKSGESSAEEQDGGQLEQIHRERRERVERVLRDAGLDDDDLFDFEDISSGPQLPLDREPADSAAQDFPEEPHTPSVPQPVPSPVPQPAPAPAPKPEILPAPGRPEIPQPMTEPSFQPEPAQPMSPQPGASPQIHCEEEPAPVKEPVPAPQVKEEILPPPPVREPPVKQPPRSERKRSSMPAGYRPITGKPVHMIELSNLSSILREEARNYPEPEPEPVRAPIPMPHRPPEAVPEAPSVPEPESDFGVVQPAGFEEETIFGAPIEEPAAPEVPEEPILFPTAPPAADEFSPEEDEGFPAPRRKKRFHVFGTEEEENYDQEELPQEAEELDDYTSPSDAPSVANELAANLHRLYLRFAVTGLCMMLLFLFGFLGEYTGILPQFLQVGLETQTYLILNLIFLFLAGAFSVPPILNGIRGLFTFQANSDSAVAISFLAAVLQTAVLFSTQKSLSGGALHLYATLASMAMFLNAAGKVSMMRRIYKNFRFVSSPDQKQAVRLFDDYNTALQLATGVVIDSPAIAYQAKTDFLKHFLKLSYEPDPSEQTSQIMAPVSFVCSLILGIVAYVLSRDMPHALTAFAAAACVGVPFMNMLSVNLPLNRLSKIASRCGAMLVGYPTVDEFSAANAVMLDAKDLFPKGTVVLNGIKTFAGQRIDDAIVDATALMCAVGGPLSDLFDQIIQSRRELLPKIDNVAYEDDKGVTGWVSGRRILIGNRSLMEAHGIEPPSRDYEEKYIQGGKKVVYLATGGDLVALFVISYNSDLRRAMELRRMEDNGISLIVRTRDPNITPRLLAECFGLDEQCIRVLPERLGEVYTELTEQPSARSAALLATKGRPTSMMRMLTACVRQRSNISLAVALQNIAVILGILLVGFLSCYSGLSQLSTAALLLYELFWAAVVWLIPRLRKP